jgi:hypothetical protein
LNKLQLYSQFAAATGIENAQKLKVLIKTRIFGGPLTTNCGHSLRRLIVRYIGRCGFQP